MNPKIVVDGFVVDKLMGEVLGEYTLHKVEHGKTYSSEGDILNVRNEDDMENILSSVDKRKLHLRNLVTNSFNLCAGNSKRTGEKALMTKTQHDLLKTLAPLVQYRNVIIIKRSELSKTLGVDIRVLLRKLSAGSPYVRFESKNVSKGFIRVTVHPDLLFRYTREGYHNAVKSSLNDWFKESDEGRLPEVVFSDSFIDELEDFKLYLQRKNEFCTNHLRDDLIGYYE